MELIQFILHVDQHLNDFVAAHGLWVYGLLLLVVFVETGVVVMPLLPGDSLLFAAGAIAARGQMDPVLLTFMLAAAAIIGDNCNYGIGRLLGPKVFERESRWIKREYLTKTHDFFEKQGPKAIIIARFMPIIRTFTPFIAGVGSMSYRRFLGFDIIGGLLWVSVCVWAGYFFGNIPVVQKNFTLVIFGIIGVSLLPGVIGYIRHRQAA